ncbi:hypothetical protein G5B40_10330 [Pikeienuella piscinae]|uniref:HIG1 domain-containing protein n=1 Tax=Pikeienuella piscinae TaxID=2748098 RepID=A0A7L5BVN0_9RHOB|nr:hypothetical protein [Pikeienuella piscinae]QIE55812.1 hypothetical protein G5B40_10330 [Pikeienuella piscinae]
MTAANILIGIGLVAAIAGLAGVVWCIRLARRVQAGKVPEDQLQSAFARLSAVNMAAIGGAMMGLAMLLVGLLIR